MLGRTPYQSLCLRIERAERRLAYQQIVVSRLRFCRSPDYAALASDLHLTMQAQVAELHRKRRDMTGDDQSTASPRSSVRTFENAKPLHKIAWSVVGILRWNVLAECLSTGMPTEFE